MIDYTQARINMVDSQIHPMGVVHEGILNAYQEIPREKFVSANQVSHAYADEDLVMEYGCFMMEASTHARLVQALDIGGEDTVLDVAGANGYSAAILSHIAQTVVAVDACKHSSTAAQGNWETISALNIAGYHVSHNHDGDDKHGPYDCILVNGSVAKIPDSLLAQLKDGGRLAAVLKPKENEQGCAVLYIRSGDNFSKQPLFDSNVPYVKGFEPKQEFIF